MSCGLSESGLAVILSSIFIGTGSIISISKKDVIDCQCLCFKCNQNVQSVNRAISPREPQEIGFQTARVRDLSSEVNRTVNVFDRTKSAIRKLSKDDTNTKISKKNSDSRGLSKNKSFP